jgi:hypothetical protein
MSSSTTRRTQIRHEFVRYIPEQLEDGVLYVSIEFATAMHRCFCGCGLEVATPFAPTQWKLIFDGASVSLRPSVGNWSYECKSHYWIDRNRIVWARRFSDEEIAHVREREQREREAHEARNRSRTSPPSDSD